MRVNTTTAGSRCVIYKNREHYIDVRHHSPQCELADFVLRGQVYKRVFIDLTEDAPRQLMQLVREEMA
jgi:hypothetical protein